MTVFRRFDGPWITSPFPASGNRALSSFSTRKRGTDEKKEEEHEEEGKNIYMYIYHTEYRNGRKNTRAGGRRISGKKKAFCWDWSSEAGEKLRRTSVSGTYLPLAIGAIYSGCKASLSFGEWTFSLKVAFTRAGQRDHYPSRGRRKPARRVGHLNTRNSRPDHVNTEAPRWQSAPRAPPVVPN